MTATEGWIATAEKFARAGTAGMPAAPGGGDANTWGVTNNSRGTNKTRGTPATARRQKYWKHL
jgi:hypothetical protein